MAAAVILDGNDVVYVYPETLGTDGYGTPTRIASNIGLAVTGKMEPVSTDEAVLLGQQAGSVMRFLTRQVFPGQSWARVEWAGRDWDVQGEPVRRNYSPLTTYTAVLLRSREAKVTP